MEALEIQREAETILRTGWTFEQYDQAERYRVARFNLYYDKRAAIRREAKEQAAALAQRG